MTAGIFDLGAFNPTGAGPGGGPDDPPTNGRHIRLTPASDIKIRPVRWVWEERLALGTLGLLAGPVGVGKSTLAYWLTARITRGDLPGEFHGHPAAVLVAAAEDSWEHTIVPRLMAARADLTRVYRVDVIDENALTASLSMPADLSQVEHAATEVRAALMLMDPLMSRLNAKLDTHKDADVRIALEPLVAIADRARMAILGLIHHNKSGSSDPVHLVMASTGFTAVARSVHTCIKDPDDEAQERRLFGTPKNNLGRSDLPTLAYSIAGHHVASTPEGEVWTGRLNWLGQVDGTIADAMRRSSGSDEERSAVTEAADWLTDYLELSGGRVDSADAKKDGLKAGHSQDSLKRARRQMGVQAVPEGFPRRSMWVAPVPGVPVLSNGSAVGASENPGGDTLDAPTGHSSSKRTASALKNPIHPPLSSGAVGARFSDPPRVLPLDDLEPSELDYQPTICPGCDQPIDATIDGDTHPACDPWRNT